MDEIELPALGEHAIGGQLGEALVEVAVLERGHLYNRHSGLDFGVDGVIEFVTDASTASGRQIGVQVKRGLSVVKHTRFGRTLYFSEQHANYWLGHSLPVIIVHVEPGTDRLRWRHANRETIRQTGNGFAIDLPEDSDLRLSLESLRGLAADGVLGRPDAGEILAIPYDPSLGITAVPEELGLAALSFSRAALRGERCFIQIDIEGEADLIASIDVIRDLAAPTNEQRRDAVVRLDILHKLRKHVARLKRALTLLLTDQVIAEAFGYQERWFADAILYAAPPMFDPPAARDEKRLEVWPGYHAQQPSVRFDVPPPYMDEFYARDPSNRELLHMGNIGGVMVGDFPPQAIATRFLPRLAHRLLTYADANEIHERDALSKIETHPNFWLVGVA